MDKLCENWREWVCHGGNVGGRSRVGLMVYDTDMNVKGFQVSVPPRCCEEEEPTPPPQPQPKMACRASTKAVGCQSVSLGKLLNALANEGIIEVLHEENKKKHPKYEITGFKILDETCTRFHVYVYRYCSDLFTSTCVPNFSANS